MLPGRKPVPDNPDNPLWGVVRFLRVVRKHAWVIILTTVVLTGAVVGYSLIQTPEYEATVKVLVGQDSASDEDSVDVFELQQLTQTVTEATLTRPVAEDVIQELALPTSADDFLDNMDVQQVKASQFVEISYTDTNPERARRAADTTGEVLSRRISGINAAGDATITATVWERAEYPEDPVSPNPIRNGAVALVVGALLGTTLAFLLEALALLREGNLGNDTESPKAGGKSR